MKFNNSEQARKAKLSNNHCWVGEYSTTKLCREKCIELTKQGLECFYKKAGNAWTVFSFVPYKEATKTDKPNGVTFLCKRGDKDSFIYSFNGWAIKKSERGGWFDVITVFSIKSVDSGILSYAQIETDITTKDPTPFLKIDPIEEITESEFKEKYLEAKKFQIKIQQNLLSNEQTKH